MSEQSLFPALHQVCIEIRDSEIETLKAAASKDKQTVALSRGQVFDLSERIQSLPQINRDVLLARYYYNMSAEETENIYGVTDAKGKCLYAEKLLGYALDLSDNETILPESLSTACKLADEHISDEIKRDAENRAASATSRKHKRRMRDILRRDGKPSKLSLAMRYAAMFTLVLLLSGAITLSVNAELRAKFFNWIITTYQEFSSFGAVPYSRGTPIDPSEIQMFDHASIAAETENIASYAPEWIPDGFYLVEEIAIPSTYSKRTYLNSDDMQITFGLADPNHGHGFDTEDSEIQTIELFGQDAFLWQRRGSTFIIFQFDGYLSYVIAELEIDSTLRIAGSVKKYEGLHQADSNKPISPMLSEMIQMRPKDVSQTMSLTDFRIDVNLASYHYMNEYGLDTAIYIQRDEEASGKTEISGFTEWRGLGAFVTWDYGNYKCVVDGSNSGMTVEEAKEIALSMKYDK